MDLTTCVCETDGCFEVFKVTPLSKLPNGQTVCPNCAAGFWSKIKKKKELTEEEKSQWLYFSRNAYENLTYLTNRLDELWEVIHLIEDDEYVQKLQRHLYFIYSTLHSDTEFRERFGSRSDRSVITIRGARALGAGLPSAQRSSQG